MRTRLSPLALGLALLGAVAACGSPPPPPAAPLPGPSPTTVAPMEEVRQSPPPPLPARPIDFPAFTEATLPNGLRLIVVERHDQPVANVDLYIETGSAADPVAKAGLAGFVADVLTRGTRTRSAEEIARTIEGAGGALSASATPDFISVSTDILSDRLPLALDLMSDVALRPTFPADELELVRRTTLTALRAQLAQPGAVASRRFARAVYGEEHPYSLAPVPETVGAIQRPDLTAFHDRYFRADNAMLVVSGDVDAERVRQLAQQYFGAWRGGNVPETAFVAPPAGQPTRIFLVHRPGSVQSNILVGHTGIRPDNPDYYPLQIMNQILGGGTDARLFMILREQKGWTYGAYSALSRPKDVGYFRASAEVRTEVTDSALAEMLRQLHRLREEPVSPVELQAAKSYLIGSFPLRIQTPGQIAAQLAQVRLLGLPVEALTRYRERLEGVSAQDVQRVARRYVRPDSAVVVVVGDATRLYDMLDDIAPITLYSVEGARLDPSAVQVRASTERFSAARLRQGTREYRVLFQGTPLGTARSTLAREGGAWVGRTTVQAGPVGQESEVRFTDDFTPISATNTISQGGASLRSELRYQNGRMVGTVQRPPQMGGELSVDQEVPQGTLFNGMDELALAAADLAPGRTITVPIFDPRSATVINGTFRVVAPETVTVPAGTFPAFRVEMDAGPQSGTLWVRQEAPHVVLKQELAGQPVGIELVGIRE